MATATTRKTPAAKKATAKSTTRFNPEDLPQTGTGQLRQGGEYKPSITALRQFAKGDPKNEGHVKALIHLGWVKPGGENAESKSPACKSASEAGLPAEAWTIGEPAGPQIAANLEALAEAGAPEEALNSLWAAYSAAGGSKAEADVL